MKTGKLIENIFSGIGALTVIQLVFPSLGPTSWEMVAAVVFFEGALFAYQNLRSNKKETK